MIIVSFLSYPSFLPRYDGFYVSLYKFRAKVRTTLSFVSSDNQTKRPSTGTTSTRQYNVIWCSNHPGSELTLARLGMTMAFPSRPLGTATPEKLQNFKLQRQHKKCFLFFCYLFFLFCITNKYFVEYNTASWNIILTNKKVIFCHR